MDDEQLAALTTNERLGWLEGEPSRRIPREVWQLRLADTRLEVARLTEERDELRGVIHGDVGAIASQRDVIDQQREDILRLLRGAEVIEIRFIPYGGCDFPGHNSPDTCWWSTLLAEMRERYRLEMK